MVPERVFNRVLVHCACVGGCDADSSPVAWPAQTRAILPLRLFALGRVAQTTSCFCRSRPSPLLAQSTLVRIESYWNRGYE